MGLIRLVFFLLILWVLWFMVKAYRTKQEQNAARARAHRKLDAGRIVKCSHCEVHLPEAQALQYNKKWFCTEGHKQAFLGSTAGDDGKH
jgi:uncharacterized protein